MKILPLEYFKSCQLAYALFPKNLSGKWHLLTLAPFQILATPKLLSTHMLTTHSVLGSSGPPGLWSWSQTSSTYIISSGEGDTFLLDWKFTLRLQLQTGHSQPPFGFVAWWSQASPATRAAGCPFYLSGAILTGEVIYATFTSRQQQYAFSMPFLFLTDLLEKTPGFKQRADRED